jgi:hypothetical protein
MMQRFFIIPPAMLAVPVYFKKGALLGCYPVEEFIQIPACWFTFL